MCRVGARLTVRALSPYQTSLPLWRLELIAKTPAGPTARWSMSEPLGHCTACSTFHWLPNLANRRPVKRSPTSPLAQFLTSRFRDQRAKSRLAVLGSSSTSFFNTASPGRFWAKSADRSITAGPPSALTSMRQCMPTGSSKAPWGRAVTGFSTSSRHPAALRSAGRASRLWLRPRSCLRPARRCRRRRAPAVDRPKGMSRDRSAGQGHASGGGAQTPGWEGRRSRVPAD